MPTPSRRPSRPSSCPESSWPGVYTVDPSFLAVLAPFYLATTFLLPWLVARLGGDGVSYREQLGQVNAFVADSIQGVRDTVAFGYEKRRGRELWRIGATMHKGQDKLYGADATQRALGEVFVTAGILGAAWWGIELALDGEISALVELPAVIAVSVIGFYTSNRPGQQLHGLSRFDHFRAEAVSR